MSAPSFKDLLAGATPGEWQHAGGEIQTKGMERVGYTCGRHKSVEEMHYTGKYIARCNPAVMREVWEALNSAVTRLSVLVETGHATMPEERTYLQCKAALQLLDGLEQPKKETKE